MLKSKCVWRKICLAFMLCAALCGIGATKTYAAKIEDIIVILRTEKDLRLKRVDRKRETMLLTNYQRYLSKLKESENAQKLIKECFQLDEEIDSFYFLCLFGHIQEEFSTSNNRNIDELKKSMMIRIMRLRTPVERRSDRAIAPFFEQKFKIRIKRNLFEIGRYLGDNVEPY